MKRLIVCSLLLCAITSRAADGNTPEKRFSVEYLKEWNDAQVMIDVASLWCSKQPQHIQQELKAVHLIPMLNVLENYCQQEALPMCKIVVDHNGPQLAGMVRMTESWTTDPKKSVEVAAHPEWTPWILALYAHATYHEQDKKEITESLLASAEQELRRLGYTEAYFGATPGEFTLCAENKYEHVADIRYEGALSHIFKKDLAK